MKKFTLILSLLVAMVTTAFAQTFDATKQYYLKGSAIVGTNKATGYMNLGEFGKNTNVMLLDDKQALSLEMQTNATGGVCYLIAAEVADATGGSAKKYIAAATGGNATWQPVLTNDANAALKFTFEMSPMSTTTTTVYNIKSDKGYLKVDNVTDTDNSKGVYTNGDMTSAAAWEVVEAKAEEEGVVTATAPVVESITPANGATVENLTEVVVTFDKEIKEYDSNVDNGRGMRLAGPATVYISEVAISGNTATCTLASALTKSGEYTIKIPAGSFIAADGGVFAGSDTNKFTFNGAPVFTSTKATTVENKLDVIRVSFDQNVAFVANHNIKKLEVKSGETTVAYITLSENADIDGAVLTLTLDEAIEPKAETTYTVEIPAGLIVETDGTKQFDGGKVTYKVKVVVPFTAEITPTSGTVLDTELTAIVVVFSENVYKYGLPAPKLVNVEDSLIEIALGFSIAANVLTLTPTTDVPNGTYSLVNWVGNFMNGAGKTLNDPNYTITVNLPTTAIDAVAADADAVIYDLSGRRVKEITVKGIYIVNGKKVIR